MELVRLRLLPTAIIRAAVEGVFMGAVYNPEADTMAEIERLELEARDLRRRLEKAVRSDDDKRVLQGQLKEVEEQIDLLRQRLP